MILQLTDLIKLNIYLLLRETLKNKKRLRFIKSILIDIFLSSLVFHINRKYSRTEVS